MDFIRKFFNGFYLVMGWLAKLIVVVMIVIIIVNVTLRYVFNSGLQWSEEIALVLVEWFTFMSFAIGVKQNLHFSLNILPARLPAWAGFIMKKINSGLTFGLALVMLVFGFILTRFTMQSILPATGFPAAMMYIIMPVSSIFILYDSLMDLLGLDRKDEHLERLLGGEEEGDA